MENKPQLVYISDILNIEDDAILVICNYTNAYNRCLTPDVWAREAKAMCLVFENTPDVMTNIQSYCETNTVYIANAFVIQRNSIRDIDLP